MTSTMTATFLGKWKIHSAADDSCLEGYAGYDPVWSPAGIFGVRLPPPGKETNVAFFLRSDGQLCFRLNNGRYVGYVNAQNGFPFVTALEEALPFVFPGFDPSNIPASFSDTVRVMPMAGDFDFCMVCLGGYLVGMDYSTVDPSNIPRYSFSQVTPTMASVVASGKGDGLDFAWIDLNGLELQGTSLIKTDLSNCNLANATFSNVTLTGADLTNANLTTAILSDCKLGGAFLINSILSSTKFTRCTLAGAVFRQADLTSITVDPPQFYNIPLQPPSPANPRTSLAGCRLNQSLIANDWSMLDLTGATILGLSSPLSSAAKPLIAKYAVLTGLNNNDLIGLTIQNAIFDNAVLDGLGLNSSDQSTSDLTNASFIQASMHGTNLTGAILKGANMTGAQLGSLSNLFTLPPGYETDLNAGKFVDAALRDQFAQHGITLSTSATIETLAADRVWQLSDVGNAIIYTVRQDDLQVLTVYASTTAASLVNAYMPNAILTGANLNGVIASGAHFYGSNARLDGSAILEEVEFNEANLSSVNFTQAKLYGANLSYAHLFNAHFNQATLSPSANGVATNLSYANLQGADFTDAKLYGTSLANAAVAIKKPTKANPNQGGVYLFSLPYSSDKTTLEQYTAELTAAATGFTLPSTGDKTTLDQYVGALNNKDLTLFKVPFARHAIVLSPNAQINNIPKEDSVWQIVDGTQRYTLWTDPDVTGTIYLFVAPSLTNTKAAFDKSGMTLRWQTSAAVDTAGQQWLLDNDSNNPQNFSTGYVGFIAELNGDGDKLDVYGTALRIVRLGDQGKQEYDTETCQVTTISITNMDPYTTCPNGSTLSGNQTHYKKDWDDQWLRAQKLPQPPTCVPTLSQFCPPPEGNQLHKKKPF